MSYVWNKKVYPLSSIPPGDLEKKKKLVEGSSMSNMRWYILKMQMSAGNVNFRAIKDSYWMIVLSAPAGQVVLPQPGISAPTTHQ